MVNLRNIVKLFLFVFAIACQPEVFFPLKKDHPVILTHNVEYLNGAVVFKGEVHHKGNNIINKYGFIIGETKNVKLNNAINIIYTDTIKENYFYFKYPNNEINNNDFFIRAFVKTDKYFSIGDSKNFTLIQNNSIENIVIEDVFPVKGTLGDTITFTGKQLNITEPIINIVFGDKSARIVSKYPDSIKAIVPHVNSSEPQKISLFIQNTCLFESDEGGFEFLFPEIHNVSICHEGLITFIEINGNNFSWQENHVYVGTDKANAIEQNPNRILAELKPTIQSGQYHISITVDGREAITETTYTILSPWKKLEDFPGNARNNAIGIGTENFVYIGTGTGEENELFSDIYKYNPTTNQWSEIKSLNYGLSGAVGFNLNDKIYITTGKKQNSLSNITYSYSGENNTWASTTSFPIKLKSAVSFSIDNEVYVGAGQSEIPVNYFYKFENNSWERISDFSITDRANAASFVINNFAYVGTGINIVYDVTFRSNNFFAYNQNNDSWNEIKPFPYLNDNAIGFSVNGKGYAGLGASHKIYEYDPNDDEWTHIANFPGGQRKGAVAITINNKTYIGTGYSNTYYNDFWEFNPDYYNSN